MLIGVVMDRSETDLGVGGGWFDESEGARYRDEEVIRRREKT